MVNIAIVGTGFIGVQHAIAVKNSSKVNVKCIVDKNIEVGKKIADEYGAVFYDDLEKMLLKEKIDFVSICTPTFLHEEAVILCAKHGVNVMCEKPLTVTIDSAKRMVDAVKENSIELLVGQVIRFWPEYIKLKEMVDNKEFGNIKVVSAKRLGQHPTWTKWHVNPSMSGGGLLDLHLHDIDYVIHVFGEVESVYATGWQSETGCWNHVITTLNFKNGVKAVVEGSMSMTHEYPFTMNIRVNGEEASAEYLLSAGLNVDELDNAKRSLVKYHNNKKPEIIDVEIVDAYQTEIEYFANCIESGIHPEVITPENALYVLSVIEAIEKSLVTGELIKLCIR